MLNRALLPLRKIFYRTLMKVAGSKSLLPPGKVHPSSSVYEIELLEISGRRFSLNDFSGKRILIVNTASQCGYTPQFAELEELRRRSEGNLVIIGVPSGDFKNQEPLDERGIAEFCSVTYPVHFVMVAKTHVTGPGCHPLYKWLSDPQLNGWNSQSPTWNFCKYLIGRDGRLLGFFNSAVSPLDELITRTHG